MDAIDEEDAIKSKSKIPPYRITFLKIPIMGKCQ